MRNIIELLELLHEHVTIDFDFKRGLCNKVMELEKYRFINDAEAIELDNYIQQFRPRLKYSKDDELLFNEMDICYEPKDWGFIPGEKKPRLDWIKERIEIEKLKEQK